MSKDRILVTGAAGFIGFSLCKSILADKFEVCGVDNINDYYDINLKKDRLKIINKYDNFKFNKINISNKLELRKTFEEFQPTKVIHLAAQAGVRYSIENPSAYVESNLVGFVNILDISKEYNVESFIYASSSSVYGGNEKIPFSIDDRTDIPLSLYGATKKSNELIAYSYSHLFGLPTIGLRFFTVYGPWGRPDMAMYIFANKIAAGKPINVFNNGFMKRDFTYIDDIINGIRACMSNNFKYEIFNLGNNNSEELMDVIKHIENRLGKKAKINFLPIQPGDVEKTFADIKKSQELLGYNPRTNIDQGIKNFIDWYLDFKKMN